MMPFFFINKLETGCFHTIPRVFVSPFLEEESMYKETKGREIKKTIEGKRSKNKQPAQR